jgi:magnesium transporter
MIRTMLCTEAYRARHQLDHGGIGVVLADEHDLLWLDLEAPTAAELRHLGEAFGFHELALEDAARPHQRPKIDRYDDFYFLAFYDLDYDAATGHVAAHELDVFLGRAYLITVHEAPIDEIDEVAARLGRNLAAIERGVGTLLYSLLDTIVDHYFPVVERLGAAIEDLERRIVATRDPRGRDRLQEEIFALRRQLLDLRRLLVPERDVLTTLVRRDLPVVSKKAAAYFQDVHDHVLRAADAVDVYRELVSGALESYRATNSDGLNQTMRILTATSIILMGVTLIAGIYGMNFDPAASPLNMPELHARYGYPGALLAMAATAAVLAWLFRRKGYL